MSSLNERSTLTAKSSLPLRTTPSLDSTIAIESSPNAWAFHRLPSRELKRRFWHVFPGILAFGLHIFPHADPLAPIMRLIIFGSGIAISLRILAGFHLIQRQGEHKGIGAILGYAFSVLLMILAFPRHLELGLAVLAILAFGDGSATLVGLTLRGPRLPWNRGKSWSGLMGFFVIGSLMTAWMYWGESHNPLAVDPKLSFGHAMLLTSPAVAASAFAESVRSRINDNIRVGIVAAIGISLLHMFRPL